MSIESITARLGSATPGPWTPFRGHEGWDIHAPTGPVTLDSGARGVDVALLAHAPGDLTLLLDVARAARAFDLTLECEDPAEHVEVGAEGAAVGAAPCDECSPCRMRLALERLEEGT